MTSESGNAFVITLVSVVLLGALTMVVARQMSGGTANAISDEKAELYAGRLIGQANTAASVVQQMLETGATIDTLNFELPNDASFEMAPTIAKVYHPAGGGLMRPAYDAEMMQTGYNPSQAGWFMSSADNVDWTPTALTDVLYVFFSPNDSVCEAINRKITGDETLADSQQYFDDFFNFSNWQTGPPTNTFSGGCTACIGRAMLCVRDVGGKNFFYAIIAQR